MKTTFATTLLALLFFSVAGLQLSAQSEADKLKAEIGNLNEKLIQAELSGDPASLMGIYSDKVILLPNNEPMTRGAGEMMNKKREEMDAGFKMISMNLTTDEVFPDKLYVTEIGHYDVTMQVPGMDKPMNDKGKYVTIWERQKDGSLKIFIDTWNTDTNPMEMHSDMMQKEKK